MIKFGHKIQFPSLLLKELVWAYRRQYNSNAHTSEFDFIYRGHFRGVSTQLRKRFNIPADNTPIALVNKDLSQLSTEVREKYSHYIKNYEGIKKFCDRITQDSIAKSGLDRNVIKLASSKINYAPSALNVKVLKHLFLIASHGQFLGPKANKYLSCIQNHYIQSLRQTTAYKKKIGIVTPGDKLDLRQIFYKQYKDLLHHTGTLKEIAAKKSHSWFLITVTAPPSRHPNSDSYNGSSPAETRDELHAKWRSIQSWASKRDIRIAGMWSMEFHKDGCPHMNFFIVVNRKNTKEVVKKFKAVYTHSKKSVKVILGSLNRKKADPEQIINYISKGLYPVVQLDRNPEKLFPRSLASLYVINLYGFIGKKYLS